MQCLNDHLTAYLEMVRSLEADNKRLESKIWEHVEKKGHQVRDWGHYFKTMEDMSAHVFASSVDNTFIVMQIGNACLVADDFKVKYEMELSMHQTMESDINGLQKVIDDTSITWFQLEPEIKALELLFIKKNHKGEVNGL